MIFMPSTTPGNSTHCSRTDPQETIAVTTKFRAGLVQMRSGRSIEANVRTASDFIRQAVAGGANYVLTPEVTTQMESDRAKQRAETQVEEENQALAQFRTLARELKVWLHIGSMAVKASSEQLANRAFLIAPAGTIAARYDKIHMFDVTLPNGESYRESKNFRPGSEAVLVDLPWGRLGMTICYDLRFPHLYRALAQGGADFLAIPSAFTKPTGKAHWHTLMRARAIENGCWVMAAAQAGLHEHGRETYGHSLVVAPWGEIVAEAAGVECGVIYADIDRAKVLEARSQVPSLDHDRPFSLKTVTIADAGR
jgi:deaminated glutathione amidase